MPEKHLYYLDKQMIPSLKSTCALSVWTSDSKPIKLAILVSKLKFGILLVKRGLDLFKNLTIRVRMQFFFASI